MCSFSRDDTGLICPFHVPPVWWLISENGILGFGAQLSIECGIDLVNEFLNGSPNDSSTMMLFQCYFFKNYKKQPFVVVVSPVSLVKKHAMP